MPLQASGTISLSQVQTEFGGANPISINEYYRDGALVPDTTVNAGIPTAGQISISQFYSTSASVPTVALAAKTIDDTQSSGTANAAISFGNTGSNGYAGEWLNPNPQPTTFCDNYEILATVVSGTLSSGTAGSWLNLGTARGWSRTRSSSGTSACTVNFKIRKVGTGTNLVDVNITLSATIDGGGCVTCDMHLSNGLLAAHALEGDVVAAHLPEAGFFDAAIEKVSDPIFVDCVRLETESGASLKCSTMTPFNLKAAKTDLEDGGWLYAPAMYGQDVIVDRDGILGWETVTEVEEIGKQWVRPISLGGKSFAAGETMDAMIYSHNTTKVIP